MLYKIELIGSDEIAFIEANSESKAIKELLKISRSSRIITQEDKGVFTTTNHWKYRVTAVSDVELLKDNIARLDAAELHDLATDLCYIAFNDIQDETTEQIINALSQYANEPFVRP